MLNLQQSAHNGTLPSQAGAVLLRPLEEEDREKLLIFGRSLPENDLLYFEDDYHSPDHISRLVNARFAENWRQIVAEVDGVIVGYSAVRRLPGWSKHVADIRLIVSGKYRRSGIGKALAAEIVAQSKELMISKLIVEMMEEQTAGRAIFEHLGFTAEGTLRDHAQDRNGVAHNLLIMAYHVQ